MILLVYMRIFRLKISMNSEGLIDAALALLLFQPLKAVSHGDNISIVTGSKDRTLRMWKVRTSCVTLFYCRVVFALLCFLN